MDSMAAPASLEARGRADWLRGEVTATSKAVWRLRQLGRNMSPGRLELPEMRARASLTGERPGARGAGIRGVGRKKCRRTCELGC